MCGIYIHIYGQIYNMYSHSYIYVIYIYIAIYMWSVCVYVYVCICMKTFNKLMYIVIYQEDIEIYLVKAFIEFPLHSRYWARN